MNKTMLTPQLLLQHGIKIAETKGLRGLTVREVAASAGVNLGSFVYHFKTRELFIEELVELWYTPIFQQLKITSEAESKHSALARLHATVVQLVQLIHQNAQFINHLIADAIAGEKAVQAFLLTLPERHPKLLIQLIIEAQAEGNLMLEPPIHQLLFIMTSTGLPLLLAGGPLQHQDWLPAESKALASLMSDPLNAQLRLEWALKGISQSPPGFAR